MILLNLDQSFLIFNIMKKFNVINYDINKNKFIEYDVIPYFVNFYNENKEKKYKKTPKTYEELKEFIRDAALYQFWGRCEYEIILVDWPCQKHEEKWDVYNQIMMNLDTVTSILMQELFENGK